MTCGTKKMGKREQEGSSVGMLITSKILQNISAYSSQPLPFLIKKN
jgi:hypothetical protein